MNKRAGYKAAETRNYNKKVNPFSVGWPLMVLFPVGLVNSVSRLPVSAVVCLLIRLLAMSTLDRKMP